MFVSLMVLMHTPKPGLNWLSQSIIVITLVIIIIIVSEYSPQFAGLIGKRDPIATLATLILLRGGRTSLTFC